MVLFFESGCKIIHFVWRKVFLLNADHDELFHEKAWVETVAETIGESL